MILVLTVEYFLIEKSESVKQAARQQQAHYRRH
jgi:hypothetical protein